nr:isochorismatase family protein [Reyranella sp.]
MTDNAGWPTSSFRTRSARRARKAGPTGSSGLHQRLQTRGIDTVIITGCATSICCESTARDAMC